MLSSEEIDPLAIVHVELRLSEGSQSDSRNSVE